MSSWYPKSAQQPKPEDKKWWNSRASEIANGEHKFTALGIKQTGNEFIHNSGGTIYLEQTKDKKVELHLHLKVYWDFNTFTLKGYDVSCVNLYEYDKERNWSFERVPHVDAKYQQFNPQWKDYVTKECISQIIQLMTINYNSRNNCINNIHNDL